MSADLAALEAELGRYAGPVAPGEEAAARAAFFALKATLNPGNTRAAG